MRLRKPGPAVMIFVITSAIFLASPVRGRTDSRYPPRVGEALRHGSLGILLAPLSLRALLERHALQRAGAGARDLCEGDVGMEQDSVGRQPAPGTGVGLAGTRASCGAPVAEIAPLIL
jgi:hypothetical protein